MQQASPAVLTEQGPNQVQHQLVYSSLHRAEAPLPYASPVIAYASIFLFFTGYHLSCLFFIGHKTMQPNPNLCWSFKENSGKSKYFFNLLSPCAFFFFKFLGQVRLSFTCLPWLQIIAVDMLANEMLPVITGKHEKSGYLEHKMQR